MAASAAVGPWYAFEIQPPAPRPGEAVTVRATFTNTLFAEPLADVVRVGSTVRVTIYFGDFTVPVTTREFPLGQFTAGTYRVEYYALPAVLPPGAVPEPTFIAADALSVGVVAVPTFSIAGMLVLVATLLLAAQRGMDRRRSRLPMGA